MSYQKNDTVTITIEDMGHEGEGIGKIAGYTLFVKDAVIGDVIEAKIIKAKKNYGYGRLMQVLTPSPYRVEPQCSKAVPCGGCQIQQMDYARQLQFKEDKVRGNLQRIGGFTDISMEPIVGMENPYHYRNKAQYPVGRDKDGRIVTGFYAGRTHAIIDNRDCLLGDTVNKEILDLIIDHMEAYQIDPYEETTGKGLVRHVLIRYGFQTGERMVCLVLNGRKLPGQDALVEKLRQIPGMTSITCNVNTKRTNVILGEEILLLWGQTYITDYIGQVQFRISPLSFYQVNPVQTEKLYNLALEYADLTGGETVWDLYCGIGTISLFLAQKAGKVYGVEIVPQAIEDARQNASLNHMENTEFYVGKAEEILPAKYGQWKKMHADGVTSKEEALENGQIDCKSDHMTVTQKSMPCDNTSFADVIVVDPPRKGCQESLLETMVQMGPKRIVYVSCDSATLARDLKYLCEHGYELQRIKPVDMFPHTTHVESVALLVRKR